MTEIKTNFEDLGSVYVADEVISTIAGTAASEVEAIGAIGNFTNEITDRIGGKKNFSRGVTVEVFDNTVTIDLNVAVKFGYRVQEVCEKVQEKVKTAVETMTGLEVSDVNVNVLSVNIEKSKNKDNIEF